ncbi:MAG: hypothetical protein FWH23_02475 [Bacteroidales bacterium]|nr:hypothetical protein [Bacteroidales bacterium]
MLKAFKKWKIKRYLRKSLKTRKRSKGFFNFNTAETVGIIFVYDHLVLQAVESLKVFLTAKNIQCKGLAYYSGKKVPSELVDNPYIRYFGKHEVNWYNKSLSAEANLFINQNFDILIDFSTSNIPVMQYLPLLSMAKMKVGRQSYPNNPYDFVLSDGSATPDIFIEELKHYLLTIDMIN